ncbi:MAG: XylR N-terminal domain-containing protein [Myxococcales bacterium]|nr:XylR N-terminal domain-containing protein [Myxococcales bacterium]
MKASEINLAEWLRFVPREGRLLLGESRMLLFRQESLGVLRQLLHSNLGPRLSRAILSQFGYRSGCGDYADVVGSRDWDTDADRLASGPVMHMWEGIVHVEPTRIEFDREAGHFLMTGIWRNSYEAELHQTAFGRSTTPVCHSLTGYASGWATAFFGQPLLAIETRCVGMGHEHCEFEIRPDTAWGAEADPWREGLSSTEQVTSRQLEALVDERTRELVSINRELLRAKEAADAAVLAKSQFLAVVSHEVRTPISAILGLAEMALQDASPESRMELVENIRSSGESLLTIVGDILDFSKIEAGRMDLERQPFSVQNCVEGAARLMTGRAKLQGLSLDVVIGGALPPLIWGDITRFRQIVLNLLSNAIKFTETGSVTLSLTRSASQSGDVLSVSVKDTGPGIPADQLDQLFKSFAQLDNSIARKHGGTGLGLAISLQLARLMGGDIHVDSTPGVGSEFRFDVPFVLAGEPETAPPSEPADRGQVPTARHSMRILVAEDNDLLARIAMSFLKRLGYDAVRAGDGAEALKQVLETDFDVVLMDMQMPPIDGLEATRLIRAQLPPDRQPWIIALTANALAADREACLDAGMNDFQSKPLEMVALSGALDRAARSKLRSPSRK